MSVLNQQLRDSIRLEEEKKLAGAAADALFSYQKFLLDVDDEDRRILYRMRIDLANIIDRRGAR